jgi:serine/threonine-protein kinase
LRRFPDDGTKCPDDGSLLKQEVDPLLGKTFGQRYRLASRLSVGRYTTIYLAQHTSVSRLCVVKVLRPRFSQDAEVRRVFLEQARLASQIVNRHVVQVIDCGEEGKRVYEVVEYAPGPTLVHLLVGGALAWRQAAHFGAQAATGLAAAHQLGVIHGGLHPASLLLTQSQIDVDQAPIIKLVGFGRARLHGVGAPRKSTMPPPASPFYAPELLQGRTVPTSDLYALGGVLHQAITGAPPTLEDDQPALSHSDVPRALAVLVEQLLVRRPERRPKDAASVAQMLAAIAATPPGETPPMPERTSDGRMLAREPVLSRRRRGA